MQHLDDNSFTVVDSGAAIGQAQAFWQCSPVRYLLTAGARDSQQEQANVANATPACAYHDPALGPPRPSGMHTWSLTVLTLSAFTLPLILGPVRSPRGETSGRRTYSDLRVTLLECEGHCGKRILLAQIRFPPLDRLAQHHLSTHSCLIDE